MAVDTPATIAILGAGPIGLEAALYARFLGYDVKIFERGSVAENVRRWGHVRMFSPFGMNRSTLGLAALAAQDEDFQTPSEEEIFTGQQWVDRYLLPLSQTDLLSDHLHENTEVCSVGRDGCLKGDWIGDEQRGELPFRILVRDSQGSERIETADVVIDATGVYGCPNWIGLGGIAALGEQALRHQIEYQIPDVLKTRRSHYAGRRILLVGSGYSAATTIIALDELIGEQPGTEVIWITRRDLNPSGLGPIQDLPEDRLPERAALARAANVCARGRRGITYHGGTGVDAITFDPETGKFSVQLRGSYEGIEVVDQIVGNVGFRPDHSFTEELQLHFCYATGGPIRLAAAMLNSPSADCLTQAAPEKEKLLHPEPHFYTLGAKSYGRNSQFLYANGLKQIRDMFSVIGDRADLDLYTSVSNLLP